MFKKLLYLLLLIPFLSISQYTISGKMIPQHKDFSWVILYQLNGAKQFYIDKATLAEDGSFIIQMPENSKRGMYRLMYNLDASGFIDVIFNNENVNVEFNPVNAATSTQFLVSKENQILNEYLNKITLVKNDLDSLQVNFFKLETPREKNKTIKRYKKGLKKFKKIQEEFNKNSKGMLAHSFIKNEQKYYADFPLETPQEFLDNEKENFYNHIDFKDANLIKSTLLSKKVIDYVFYLNASDDADMQRILFKEAIDKTMRKIGDNEAVKSQIIYTLLYTFAQTENLEIVNYLLKNYYKKLSKNYKNEAIANEIREKVKLAIGANAPYFEWKEGKKTKNLYDLPSDATYIIVFWSTDCSHCLDQIPKLYQATKNSEKVKVIAYTIEKDELGFNYHSKNFPEWINILGLDKWDNKVSRNYEVVATPTYFILDGNKKIIAKPYEIKEVLEFIKNLEK